MLTVSFQQASSEMGGGAPANQKTKERRVSHDERTHFVLFPFCHFPKLCFACVLGKLS